MDVFTIKGQEHEMFKLERNIFERITEKSKVYYRDDGSHYAICPGCHNPIQIINLINKNTHEKGKRSRPRIHGRHYNKDVEGLVKYNREKYSECQFANPECLGTERRRRNKNANNEIIALVKENNAILLKYIRNITAINFSKSRFEEFLEYFMVQEGYDYEYINRFNLPYSFLYLQREISIFGNYLLSNERGNAITSAIENRSKYFKVHDNKIVRSDASFVKINLVFFNHRIHKDRSQTVEFHIIEQKDEIANTIYQETISIDLSSFILEIQTVNP